MRRGPYEDGHLSGCPYRTEGCSCGKWRREKGSQLGWQEEIDRLRNLIARMEPLVQHSEREGCPMAFHRSDGEQCTCGAITVAHEARALLKEPTMPLVRDAMGNEAALRVNLTACHEQLRQAGRELAELEAEVRLGWSEDDILPGPAHDRAWRRGAR